MNHIACDYLNEDGRCKGLYEGFGCIKDKCLQESKKRPIGCAHMRGDGYCTKYGKFICQGEGCEDYLSAI